MTCARVRAADVLTELLLHVLLFFLLLHVLLLFFSPPPSREHLIRLQHENKMLKLEQEGSDNQRIALLQSLLEDAGRRASELETENR